MKRILVLVLLGLFLAFGIFWLTGGRPIDLLRLLVGLMELLGSETEVVVPERPPSVPETAVWAGGVDGGAWIECSVELEQKANWCTIWSDQTGEVWARTSFVLRDTGKPVSDTELTYTGFTGTYIGLADGRMLEPVKFHGVERDPWERTPIDPPRAGSSSVPN